MSDGKEVGGESGEMWNREGTIEGTYLSKQSGVGPNESMVYNLETKDGTIGVWGSTVLDTKMENVQINSLVRIEYLGKAQAKSGRGEYHDFKVMTKPAEFTEVKKVDPAKAQEILGGDVI